VHALIAAFIILWIMSALAEKLPRVFAFLVVSLLLLCLAALAWIIWAAFVYLGFWFGMAAIGVCAATWFLMWLLD